MVFLCLFPTRFFCSWLALNDDQHPHLSRHSPNPGIKGAFQTAISIKDDCEQWGRKICREAAHWSSILFSGEPMSPLPVVELVATPKPVWMSLGTLEQPLSSWALVCGKERKRKPPRFYVSLPLFCVMASLDFLASLWPLLPAWRETALLGQVCEGSFWLRQLRSHTVWRDGELEIQVSPLDSSSSPRTFLLNNNHNC